MQNLANAVLDYYLFLFRVEENELDSERAMKMLELFDQIENKFSDVEKQELQEAAKRRLQRQEQMDENGYIPHYPVEFDQDRVLENIASGWFDIPGIDDIRDPDEQYDE